MSRVVRVTAPMPCTAVAAPQQPAADRARNPYHAPARERTSRGRPGQGLIPIRWEGGRVQPVGRPGLRSRRTRRPSGNDRSLTEEGAPIFAYRVDVAPAPLCCVTRRIGGPERGFGRRRSSPASGSSVPDPAGLAAGAAPGPSGSAPSGPSWSPTPCDMPTLAAGLRLHLRHDPAFGSSFVPDVEFRR